MCGFFNCVMLYWLSTCVRERESDPARSNYWHDNIQSNYFLIHSEMNKIILDVFYKIKKPTILFCLYLCVSLFIPQKLYSCYRLCCGTCLPISVCICCRQWYCETDTRLFPISWSLLLSECWEHQSCCVAALNNRKLHQQVSWFL